jgi:hypothetical protein
MGELDWFIFWFDINYRLALKGVQQEANQSPRSFSLSDPLPSLGDGASS